MVNSGPLNCHESMSMSYFICRNRQKLPQIVATTIENKARCVLGLVPEPAITGPHSEPGSASMSTK